MARWVTLGAVVAAAAVLAAPARAAGPNYILVSGPGLAEPVLLDDWGENVALLSTVGAAPKAKRRVVRGLARRPRFDLAEFWAWGENPPPTRPSGATQHGWFYPARRGKPAVFQMMANGTRAPRLAPRQALEILARHGVPTRLCAR